MQYGCTEWLEQRPDVQGFRFIRFDYKDGRP
jgi:hypothetical protein